MKYTILSDELREQRARLLARAAPLEADVGALLSATVDAVPPAAARARLRDLDERGHARLAVFEAQAKFFLVLCECDGEESLQEWTPRRVNTINGDH